VAIKREDRKNRSANALVEAMFQMFLNTNLMSLMATKSTVEEILELTEQRYADMLAEPGKWSGVDRLGKSTFNVTAEKAPAPVDVDQHGAERTCWNWGQIGHLSRECPTRDSTGGGGGRCHSGGDNAISWRRSSPQANEEKTKIVSGFVWLWCGTCGFFNTGKMYDGPSDGRS
jgi:hypothetical protein